MKNTISYILFSILTYSSSCSSQFNPLDPNRTEKEILLIDLFDYDQINKLKKVNLKLYNILEDIGVRDDQDLLKITQLDLSSVAIRSIKGVDLIPNLKILKLNTDKLSDIQNIKNLKIVKSGTCSNNPPRLEEKVITPTNHKEETPWTKVNLDSENRKKILDSHFSKKQQNKWNPIVDELNGLFGLVKKQPKLNQEVENNKENQRDEEQKNKANSYTNLTTKKVERKNSETRNDITTQKNKTNVSPKPKAISPKEQSPIITIKCLKPAYSKKSKRSLLKRIRRSVESKINGLKGYEKIKSSKYTVLR